MDTDYARVAHYQRFLSWVEDGFQAWCNARGISFKEQLDQGIGWPLVDVRIQYYRPLTLEDEVLISMVLKDVSAQGMTLEFTIYRSDEKVAADGYLKRRFISQADMKGREATTSLLATLSKMEGEEADLELN
jgi:YbgC/YbaW family acyl-CoA thioester hydrolase